MEPEPRDSAVERRFVLPWTSIFKVLGAAVLVWAWLRIWPIALIFATALLLAVTLEPVVRWLGRHQVPRWLAVLMIGVVILGSFGFMVAVVVPPFAEQAELVANNVAEGIDWVKHHAPKQLRGMVGQAVDQPLKSDSKVVGEVVVGLGQLAATALTVVGLAFILMLYLLIDGRRVYAWLLAYVPSKHRARVAETVAESSEVVFAYVAGQFITSAICAVYVFIVLWLLKVPAALVLALVAGIFDVLPVLGFIISVVPSVLLGLTVSPPVALAVLGAYIFYHILENYLIIPRVYGDRLRLSTLAVILGLTVGGELGGIIGAVLVLPLLAVYPIIERIWLSAYVGREAVREHVALDETAGHKDQEKAVDLVLKGERPAR